MQLTYLGMELKYIQTGQEGNKMKIIPISIMMMLMMAVLVLAEPPTPAPIRGYFKINDKSIAGYIIEAENLRTREVISGNNFPQLITQSGGFAFDLSFFKQKGYAKPIEGVYPGDVIEVRAVGTDIKVRFNVPEVTPYEITLSIIVEPSIETQLIYKCIDGNYVRDASLCPPAP